MEQINGTWIPDKMFEVSADNTDALSKIEGVEVIQIDGKTAVVYGNNADAQRKIQDVINQGIPGKTSIIADDAQFWARWAVIQAQQNITKYVDIVTRAVDATAGKGSATGNMFNGGDVQAFATGGMPSGFYKGPTRAGRDPQVRRARASVGGVHLAEAGLPPAEH
ncbi:hypothetical protein EVAR_101611_1 [Eumeta japonica]|uniref:Uncharacterized protein n=1 Tax=Eumeta variegata TaxID=151549 RepID=A0A4C1SUF9_EUMVA|nr:hypothetical protein EVAR_101611_1 [Eumeta japonica]